MKIVSFFESIKIWWWVEKVQANLSKWLVSLWYDFTHLVLEDRIPRNDYSWEIFSMNEKFIFWFWIKKIISLFRLWYKVAKYCNKEKVDVIIWQWDFFYMIVSVSKILFWNKSKCIWVVHTTIWIWTNYIKKVLIFLLKKLDKIVLISKEEHNTFINEYWFKKEKLEIIYNSIDLDEIEKKLESKLAKEYEYLFNNKKFTFINVWRLTYQKNHKLLIQAFDNLYSKYNDIQLIVLWDWELKEELLNLKDSLISKNDIHFLWNQENIFPFLKKSNCFVLGSLFEGFPMVLLEVVSSNLLIISTNCQTWPNEIIDKKFLVNLDENILSNLSNKMQEVYLNIACSKFQILLNENKLNLFSQDTNIHNWDKLLKML